MNRSVEDTVAPLQALKVPHQDTGKAYKSFRMAMILPLLALCLDIWGLWITNAVLYPKVYGIFPLARDLSSIAGILMLVAIAGVVSARPERISEKSITVLSFGLYAFGYVCMMAGIISSSVVLLVTGAILRAVGSRWVVVMVGAALASLPARPLMTGIAAAFVGAYVLRIGSLNLADGMLLVILGLLPFCSYALARGHALPFFESLRHSETHRNASITEPDSFLPFGHVLFIAIFLFRAVFGFALGFGAVEGNPQQSFLPMLVLIVLSAIPLLRARLRADVLYTSCVLLVVAGLLGAMLVIDMTDYGYLRIVFGFLYGGSECFEVLVWFVLASIARQNPANALVIVAWGRASASAGLLVGVSIAHMLEVVGSWHVMMVGLAVCLFIFVAINETSLKNVSFDDIIKGVAAKGESREGMEMPAQAHEEKETSKAETVFDLDTRCAKVAEVHHLTPRETEILGYLARGRNAAYLQETLVLSRNTIKTHVSNIYTKLGVHSQQELIDVVESSMH